MNLKEYVQEKKNSIFEKFQGEFLFDEPMFKHTYYRIGGNAAVLVFPKSVEDLICLNQFIRETQCPFQILGFASNVLISDEGYNGLMIRLNKMSLETNLVSENILRTSASVAISSLLRKASQEGWEGLEFLTGIPGSIGGAVYMNAGTHLGEVKDHILKVETVSLTEETHSEKFKQIFHEKDLQFSYRKNLFLPRNSCIYSVDWKIKKQDPKIVKSKIDEILLRRKSTQPIQYPSCGSVFKNPKSSGLHAWEVIDRLGLRGYQLGQSQFSEKHPNFIINLGNAKSKEVRALIEMAQNRALKELGVVLEKEVIFI